MPAPVSRPKHLLGAIDQGTTSSRFVVYDENLRTLSSFQMEHKQHTSQPGWVEHDPLEIAENVVVCMTKAVDQLEGMGITGAKLDAIGITNQRETIVMWDKTTGLPLHHAIVWSDVRTAEICQEVLKANRTEDINFLRHLTGLPLSTYFSAPKIQWLMENVSKVKQAVADGVCLCGTIDCWLLYYLSRDEQGKQAIHVTDVSNASRTFLMNIHSLQWDGKLLEIFHIPNSILPEIRNSSECYGVINNKAVHPSLLGVPLSASLGDQQASSIGQGCFHRGQTKNTYGTGCFLMMNTGLEVVHSRNGNLATVLYAIPSETADGSRDVYYGLEGAIANAGSVVQWIRDNLGFIKSASEIEEVMNQVPDNGGVYFVPAFSGLFAPYWRPDARGTITGMTQHTTKAHLCRATLMSICFMTQALLGSMLEDINVPITAIRVDGGMVMNGTMMQMQADIAGIPVIRAPNIQATSMGAAIMAGLAKGISIWKNTAEVAQAIDKLSQSAGITSWQPNWDAARREAEIRKWNDAIQRSFPAKSN